MAQMIKNLPIMQEPGLIPGSGRSPGEENGSPLLHSCLENPLDRGAWEATTPGGCKESDMTEQLTLTHTKMEIHTFLCKYAYLFLN